MPLIFEANYTPIAAAGTDNHKQHVAKLLASLMCSSDEIIPELSSIKYEDEPMEIMKEEMIKKMEEDEDMLLAMPAELNIKSYRIELGEAEELSYDALVRLLENGKNIKSKSFKEIHTKAITRMAVMGSEKVRSSK